MTRVRPVVLVFLSLILLSSVTTAVSAPAPLLSHRARVRLDTATNQVEIEDEVVLPAGVTELRLGAGFTITKLISLDNALIDVRTAVEQATDEDGPYQKLLVSRMGLEHGGLLRLAYEGTFLESVQDVVFSRENVGNEITATIGDEGIYLSSSSGWLVGAKDLMGTYELVIDTPADFETVTQGERTFHQISETGLQTRWIAVHPSDGINLIANRYFVHEEPVRDGVVSMTFFLEDDARLRATYMERTKAYIAMYEEMIGPYPYAKFATVENWFPTGYGMPSYTLLGGQVLRLPFIPYTSFGHEIAHNWWGNSVFVDTEEGNWCEGLTVYCADYHYKELESAAAARDYRRNTLKEYAAYVKDPAHDFPLREFRSRHSGATRAVGYGKSMFVFHMVDQMIGRDNFLNSLRAVAADHQYTAAAWSDFMAMFADAGQRDLDAFQAQWLNRTGAPTLSLGEVDFGKDKVELEIRQTEPVYELDIPVVVTMDGRDEQHTVHLDSAAHRFVIEGRGIDAVAVDPDYHLFRRLHPQEIEATVSQVLAEPAPVFVMGPATAAMQTAGRAFASGFAEDDSARVISDGRISANGHANILLNPDAALLKRLAPAELKLAGQMIFLGGKRYARDEFDLVFAAPDPDDGTVTHLVVLCGSPERLEGLATRVSHYGKYSWLLLPVGSGRPERGNWTPGASPLTAAETTKR